MYRSTGTSFAAPIVTGVASLLLSGDPTLSGADVRRILEQSASDIETPGVDQFTGYGLLDAKAALEAERSFFIAATITGITRALWRLMKKPVGNTATPRSRIAVRPRRVLKLDSSKISLLSSNCERR